MIVETSLSLFNDRHSSPSRTRSGFPEWEENLHHPSILSPLLSPLLSPALPSLRFLSNSLPNMEANGERRRRLVHAPRSQFQGGARLRRSSPYKETRDPKFAVAEFLYGRRRHAVRERGKDEGRMFRQNEASVENE